jgi:hypothetical protein
MDILTSFPPPGVGYSPHMSDAAFTTAYGREDIRLLNSFGRR